MTYLCEEDGEPLKQSKLSVAIIFQHMSIPLMVKDWSDATSVQATHSFFNMFPHETRHPERHTRSVNGSLKRTSRRDRWFIVLEVGSRSI